MSIHFRREIREEEKNHGDNAICSVLSVDDFSFIYDQINQWIFIAKPCRTATWKPPAHQQASSVRSRTLFP